MSKLDSQSLRVLNRLKQGPLTQVEALSLLGVGRLGARVFDLRREGYVIDTRMVEIYNRFDDKCRVAQYFLVNKNQTRGAAA